MVGLTGLLARLRIGPRDGEIGPGDSAAIAKEVIGRNSGEACARQENTGEEE